MTRRATSAAVAAVASILVGFGGPMSAQAPRVCLDSGVVAYEDVSYDVAGRWLSQALASRGADSLNSRQKATALMYLGAAQWLLQNGDSAGTVFRVLLTLDPRHQPDSLVFPKRVTDAFEGIRKSVYGVARVGEIPGALRVTVFAVNPHMLSVDVFGSDGTRLVNLFEGPSRDSVSVDWPEFGFNGKRIVPFGRYDIVVTARDSAGKTLRVSRLPVTIAPR